MAVTVSREYLSNSSSGEPIQVSATSGGGSGTPIHTCGGEDEVYISAVNNHTADVLLTIELGGTSANNIVKVTLPFKAGLEWVIPGLTLASGKVITAFAAVTNVVNLAGYVNRISD